MKIATFRRSDGAGAAALVDVEAGCGWWLDAMPGLAGMGVLDLVRDWDRLRGLVRPAGDPFAIADFLLDAPFRPRRNLFCVGKNYRDHVREMDKASGDLPQHPILFSKVPDAVIGPFDPIHYPQGVSEQVDYEAELAVIIGTQGRAIAAADAFDHIWGYTILNDVTARDLQKRHQQWLIGKSLDTFCPMGPFAVSADELDPRDLAVRCWVNGDLRQQARTSEMIFDIPTLIETISRGITLFPGDVISTGTPAGVGSGREPPCFLRPGDLVEIEIEGIGRLANPVTG